MGGDRKVTSSNSTASRRDPDGGAADGDERAGPRADLHQLAGEQPFGHRRNLREEIPRPRRGADRGHRRPQRSERPRNASRASDAGGQTVGCVSTVVRDSMS
jgi:hypothetical protein